MFSLIVSCMLMIVIQEIYLNQNSITWNNVELVGLRVFKVWFLLFNENMLSKKKKETGSELINIPSFLSLVILNFISFSPSFILSPHLFVLKTSFLSYQSSFFGILSSCLSINLVDPIRLCMYCFVKWELVLFRSEGMQYRSV